MKTYSFSNLNLIDAELERISNNYQSHFDKFLSKLSYTKKVSIELCIDRRILFRGLILCDDITEVGNLEKPFSIQELLQLLYDDFINEVRAEDHLESIFKKLASYHFHQENQEEEYASFRVSLDRRKALRGEVLLSDLARNANLNPFTLEDLLSFICTDFCMDFNKNGGREKVIMGVLKRIEKTIS